MKLRIQGNTVRLRVRRPELAALMDTGRLAETVRFAVAPEAALTYTLECANCADVHVRYAPGHLAVVLPWPVARQWAAEDEVSVSAAIDTGGATLAVLVEKDFACLHGTAQENADSFANPKMESRG